MHRFSRAEAPGWRKQNVAALALPLCALGAAVVFALRDEDRVSLLVPPARDSASSGNAESLVERNAHFAPDHADRARFAKDVSNPAPDAAELTAHPLEAIKEDLAFHATAALDGTLYMNTVLEHMLEFASLDVAAAPDLDYEDDDAVAYKLEGTPEGTEARVLVGLMPYEEDGRTFRYLQMQLDVPQEPEFLHGAMREGPNVNFSISYDVTDPTTPTRFALMLKRRVDLAASRAEGIDAYTGRFTNGVYYWNDFLDTSRGPSSTTWGLVDGAPVSGEAFDGVNPLGGNTYLDLELLERILTQLQRNLSAIKGE